MKIKRFVTFPRIGHRRRSTGIKMAAFILLLALLICCVTDNTLAWLTAQSEDVINTFSTSDIGVDLRETPAEYKMIPGWTINKDPKAKVTSGSEDCYLFIKVEKSANFDTYMDYAVDDRWLALEEVPGVYYMKIDAESKKNVDYNILGEGTETYNGVVYTWEDNQVLVKPSVTKEMLNGLTDDTKPSMTFTAYAVQLKKNNTQEFGPLEAWNLVQGL